MREYEDTVIYLALKRDKKALARIISLIERDPDKATLLLRKLWPRNPRSHVVGFTGPGGVGKSTLISSVIKLLTDLGKSVAVLAIDPSSPISGGALLGDRVRMRDVRGDVFIRSMSTAAEESLPWKALIAVEVLEGVGFDYILLETPGVGQFNVEIMNAVDTVVLVLMPELGDEIQSLKAGLMEIGHIYVVNKADLPGADLMASQIEASVSGVLVNGWKPCLVKTIAFSKERVRGLVEALFKRDEYLRKRTDLLHKKRANRWLLEVRLITEDTFKNKLHAYLSKGTVMRNLLNEILSKGQDTITLSNLVLKELSSMIQENK